MTYHATLEEARADHPWRTAEGKHCFCCGKPLDGPTVAYDAHPVVEHLKHRVLMHRDCAFAMAQRIICDAWPNRHDGEPLQTAHV